MDIAIVNDTMMGLEQVDSALLDRGTYFGDGVYEVLRSYHGKLFALDGHLSRFARSLTEIEITGICMTSIKDKIVQAFHKSGYENAKIYFHITRGSQLRNHLPSRDIKPNFFLTVESLKDKPEEKIHGIKVSTYPDLRWKRCDIKKLNLLPNIMARMDAERKGCYESILVNDAGQITEGAGSAFFAVDAGRRALITRPLGPEILPSITRCHVIEVAAQSGLSVIEEAITPAQAAAMDELIMAVTTKDIVPITVFDGCTIGSGKCGKHTAALIENFKHHTV